MSDDSNKVSDERMAYLRLFNKIMQMEHENKHTKADSDKMMQDKIKKLIQQTVQL